MESVRERSGEDRLLLLFSKVLMRLVVGFAAPPASEEPKMSRLLLVPVLVWWKAESVAVVRVGLRIISPPLPGVVSMLCLPPLKSLLVSLPLCTVCALSGLAGGVGPSSGVEEPVVPVVPALDLESTKGSEEADS